MARPSALRIEIEARRAGSYQGFLKLITRAKATGHLRDDFASEDLVILLMANAGVIAATADDAPLPPIPDAPTSAALCRAMTRFGRPATNEPCGVTIADLGRNVRWIV